MVHMHLSLDSSDPYKRIKLFNYFNNIISYYTIKIGIEENTSI